tara:strand:- start:616 stop:1164 length:549 start_codon:yes stop_codon:yes gene_type:complete
MKWEIDPKNERFHRAFETNELIKALLKVKVGMQVTYKALSKVAMGDCAFHGPKYSFLLTARCIVRKQTGIEFKAIHNVGLRHMTDEEKITKSSLNMASIGKKAKRIVSSITSTNYHRLSADNKIEHNTNLSIMNAVGHMNSPEKIAKVQRAVKAKKEPLALTEFKKMFNAKYSSNPKHRRKK